MEDISIWAQLILTIMTSGIVVGLLNAFGRWRASKAAEPHDYAKSYQVVVQTRDNLAKSLKEEQRQNKLNQEGFNKKLDELSAEIADMSVKMASVQHDARVYARELKNLEIQHEELKKEYEELKKKYAKLQAAYDARPQCGQGEQDET